MHMHLEASWRIPWIVGFHAAFEPEFADLPEAVQDELLGRLRLLAEVGPNLGRPNVDTLAGTRFPNLKELRFRLGGVWRFAFAFDPRQQAIVLVGGDKKGERQDAFYKSMIRTAERRFKDHLDSLIPPPSKKKR